MNIRDAVERAARFEREQVNLPEFADWLERQARRAPRSEMEMSSASVPPETLVLWGAGELIDGPVGVGLMDDRVLLLLGEDVILQIHPDLTADRVSIDTDGVPVLDMSRGTGTGT